MSESEVSGRGPKCQGAMVQGVVWTTRTVEFYARQAFAAQ